MTDAVLTPPATPPATPPVTLPESTPPVAPPTPPVAATPPVETPPVTPPPVAPEGHEPQAPETYTLTLPEQSPLAQPDVDRITQEAKALGLTNAQAQKYLDSQSQLVKTAVQALEQEGNDLKADPVLGGAHFTATVKDAQAGMTYLFGSDMTQAQDFFDRLGLGNNKLLVKGLAKLGKALSEDSAIRAAAGRSTERKETKDVLFSSSAQA